VTAATTASLLVGVTPAASAGTATVVLSQAVARRSPSEVHTVTATVTGADGQPAADGTAVTFTISGPANAITVGSPLVGLGLYTGGTGGWTVHADGSVDGFGAANPVTPPTPVSSPAIELAATPTGGGYWVTTADGNVLTAGDAVSYGNLASVHLNGPIVGMTPTASGHGYYLLGSDGGIFCFGDAIFRGSMGSQALPAPVIGLMPTPTGAGYWLFGSDGGVYAFGDAASYGDTHGIHLNRPIVDATPTADGKGYWLVADDGGIFAFGDAAFYGSLGGTKLNGPISRIVRSTGGHGYLMATRDGGVWSFGDGPQITNPGGYTVTTVGGQATLRFSSATTGDSIVGASIGGSPATATATPVTVHWASGPPASVILTGLPTAPLLTTQTAYVTALVKDASGYPVDDGTAVAFTASGTGAEDPAAGTVATSRGQAQFSVRSTAAGHSTVVATAGGVSGRGGIDWRNPSPDLRVTLSGTPATVTAGGEVSFTATVSSSGSLAATGATLTVLLPAGATPEPVQPGAWSCTVLDRGLSCHTGALANPGSSALRFGAVMGGPADVFVQADVDPDNGPDFQPADNTTQLQVHVLAPPTSLTLSQSGSTGVVGAAHQVTATSDGADGTLVTFGVDVAPGPLAGRPFAAFAATPDGSGYWLATASGTILARGSAASYGDAGPLTAPVVDLRSTPTGQGYWITAADGTVVSRGDAQPLGSVPSAALAHPIVGMGVTPTGHGYWLAGTRGDVYSFGDARFFGSVGNIAFSPDVVSFEATPTGGGYWLMTADSGIFAFGDARFYGSLGGMHLSAPIADLAASPSGNGYWMVTEAGSIFAFGDAKMYGSSASPPLGGPVVGLRPTGNGYWTFGRDGAVFAFGQAKFMGPVTTAALTSGHASVSFTSPHTGSTSVVAAVSRPGGLVTSGTLSTTWTPAPTGHLTLSPAQSTVNVGVSQHVAATVTDPSGAAVPDGTVVSFTVSGPGSGNPTVSQVTTVGGTASFAFTSSQAGTSSVAAASGNLSALATVDWTVPPSPPSAPRTVTATAGDGTAVVTWRAPISDGGSAVFQYTVKASPGGKAVTAGPGATSATVDGLQNGTSYTFTVTANNTAGTGPASAPSAPVTPHGATTGGSNTGGSTGTGGGGNPGGTTGTSGGSNPGAGDAGSGGTPGVGPSTRAGYWMLGAGGAVYAFGDAVQYGQPALAAGVDAVDLEPTPSAAGYWVVDSNGVVHTFGAAPHLGDVDRSVLSGGEKVTSLSATPSGKGYWVFTTRGRVVPFGDARFVGDMSKVALNGPVLDSIPTPTGLGYYMVASDGGIFAFGDAHFAGSMGGRPLNKPVQSLVPDSDGSGYWLVASDGGIFAFDAPFRGSMGGKPMNKPVKGMVRYGDGYLMVATDGGIFSFSDKPFAGSLGANPPSRPIVSVAVVG
jgi:hypothetical protein